MINKEDINKHTIIVDLDNCLFAFNQQVAKFHSRATGKNYTDILATINGSLYKEAFQNIGLKMPDGKPDYRYLKMSEFWETMKFHDGAVDFLKTVTKLNLHIHIDTTCVTKNSFRDKVDFLINNLPKEVLNNMSIQATKGSKIDTALELYSDLMENHGKVVYAFYDDSPYNFPYFSAKDAPFRLYKVFPALWINDSITMRKRIGYSRWHGTVDNWHSHIKTDWVI